MKRTITVALLVVLAGGFVAWWLIAQKRPAANSPAAENSAPRAAGLTDRQSRSESIPIWATMVTPAAPAARRPERSLRDLQAGRAVSLGVVSEIYGPLLEQLRLSDDVRKRFLELVCDERQSAYDVVSTARKEKVDYLSNPTVERMALEAATSADAEIRGLLSPDEFNQFVAYRAMRTIQVSVSKVVESIADSGSAPLTDSQVQGLIKVFVDAQTPGQLRRAPINAVLNLDGVGITEPVVSSARGLLSEPQLAALLEVRAGQLAPPHDKIGASPQPAGGH